MSFGWHGGDMPLNNPVYTQQMNQMPFNPQMGMPGSQPHMMPGAQSGPHMPPPNMMPTPQNMGVMGIQNVVVPPMVGPNGEQSSQNPQMGPQQAGKPPVPPQMGVPPGVGGAAVPPAAAAAVAAAAVPPPASVGPEVCNVWRKNLAYHMSLIRYYIAQFNFVTVDVKFPGVVSRPIGTFHTTAEFHYQTLRSNIDMVEPLQIGLTLTDAQGNVPPGSNHMGTWQFNFFFDPTEAMCSAEGLEVLKQSGLDLPRHQTDGIKLDEFFEALTDSGLIMNPQVTWITFYSGYDLGLLVSQLINTAVPTLKEDYMKMISIYFPQVWDVKTLVKAFQLSTKSHLHEIAEDFQLFRGSVWSSAGADSRLTALCFYEIMRSLGDHAFSVKNKLFGLEEEQFEGEAAQAQAQAQVQAQARAQAQAQAQVQAQAQAHAQAQAQVSGARDGQPDQVGTPMMGLDQPGMGAPGQLGGANYAAMGGMPGMGPPGSVPPIMPMHNPYMFNANPQAGGRQPVYYQR